MAKPKPTITIEPLLYPVPETCARLGIGRSKFYAEVAAGEIETVQIGDRRFTTDEQQRRYVARKQRQTERAVVEG
jgi:hypothetical protein